VRFDGHEHRLAAEEDLIQAQAQNQGLAQPVEHLQQLAGATRGLVDPASQGGAAGQLLGRQEDGQEDEDLREAQAHGAGGRDELPPLLFGEVNRRQVGVPKFLVFLAQGGEFGKELLTARTVQVGVADGLLDLGGVVVDGLPRAARILGLSSDVAVLATQRSSSVADPGEEG
jgi:hypothetical protein